MALITFNDKTKAQAIPHDKALAIWQVLNGDCEPHSEAQAAFVARISNVYMSKHLAPPRYLKMRHIDVPEVAPVNGLEAWINK